MELEQVKQKLEWLDDERRHDKSSLVSIENRITTLEGNLTPLVKQINDLNGEITRLNTLMGRLDQFDEAILQSRIDAKQGLDELKKQITQREEEMEKVREVETRAYGESLSELRRDVTLITELQRGLTVQAEEDLRLGRDLNEIRQRIDSVRRSDEEYVRSYRLLEDGRRQDSKRLTDLQGEVTALRKQMDDQRARTELAATTMQKNETRLNELFTLEAERQEDQAKFLEGQMLIRVERDQTWKEWESRFETVESQTSEVESNLQKLDSTHRAIKRTRQSVEELNELIERRIKELTEIQRLSEERFRQEWVTFKADDQKRWTNYALTQEEQRGEANRQYEKLAERVTQIEDNNLVVQDLLQQMNELTEKRLQVLLASVSEWVSSFERSIGRVR